MEITLGGVHILVRGRTCSVDGPATTERARNKSAACRRLAAAGLPVPAHLVATLGTLETAGRFVASAPGPCVVKPARDTGAGNGVTMHVRTQKDLRQAAIAAAVAGARGGRAGRSGSVPRRLLGMSRNLLAVPVLVERHVDGANFRLLYLDGVLLDAIRREPPSVVGDGTNTVATLINQLNATRLRVGGAHGQRLVSRNVEMIRTLASQGLTLTAVPDAGVHVRLKSTVNETSPEGNRSARHEICDAVIEQGRRAAAAVGVRLAGVDIITPDPTAPLGQAGGCVLEVNTEPGLAMHLHGHDGEVPVATEMLRQLAQPQTEHIR